MDKELLSEEEAIKAYENNNPADDHATGVLEVAKAERDHLHDDLGWRSREEVALLEGNVKHARDAFDHAQARITELELQQDALVAGAKEYGRQDERKAIVKWLQDHAIGSTNGTVIYFGRGTLSEFTNQLLSGQLPTEAKHD